MGYKQHALESFLDDLERHRKIVEELFSSMFRQPNEDAVQRVSSAVGRLMQVIHDEPSAVSLMAELGF